MIESPLLRAPDGQSGGSSLPPDDKPALAIETPPPRLARAKPLSVLLHAIDGGELRGGTDVEVTQLAYRSTDVGEGALFFCAPGGTSDGHTFADAAAAAGAAALVVERWVDVDRPQVLVPSVRRAMGPISAVFFDRPSERLTVVGVTGTNGKTTTTYLLESIFRAAGIAPGVVGTTGVRIDGQGVPFDRTTPEAPDLQRLLADMADRGLGAVAMEVSSHGLHQHRVDGTRYRCSVFTNLSQDHLDYHGTLDAYLEAKARLFTPELSDRAVINADTPEGRLMVERSLVPTITFGLGAGANVMAEDVTVGREGLTFTVGGVGFRSPLRGRFNLYNCVGALAAAREVGIHDDAIARGLDSLLGVPGRFEPVEAGQDFAVLVDYAHTPDSLENVLRAARDVGPGRVIVVFGCGGDRDRGKRPLMGEAATRGADLAVITSDNPRSEDPESIIAEIRPGAVSGGGRFFVEPDRRSAIRAALAEAAGGDVVVIAGKGHETGQEFADRTIPFDDRIVAFEELARILEEAGQ